MHEIKKLPLSRTDFSVIRNKNMIYVDKTDMIASIAQDDSNVAFFLGRPRRFGKTLLLSTFEDLFTNGLKNFKGLKIDKQNLWSETKTYPVLHLDFSKFKEVNDIHEFKEKFKNRLVDFTEEYHLDIIVGSNDPIDYADAIFKSQINTNLVLLIDEYDAALNANIFNKDLFEKIRKVYSNFLATVKSYERKFRFIFVTGVTRYTHASIFSPFNILYDLSLNPHYQSLLGYTDEELMLYFDDYLEIAAKELDITKESLHQKLREYYDGYYFTPDLKVNLYCPFSILNFFKYPDLGFKNYWNESGAGTDVVNRYFKKYPISCSEILKGIEISPLEYRKGCNISNINFAVLLQQAGYYTFAEGTDQYEYVFKVPNKEVANVIYPIVFENTSGLRDSQFNQVAKTTRNTITNLYSNNEEEAQNNFIRVFDFIGYDAINPLLASEVLLRDFLFLTLNISLNPTDGGTEYIIFREEINFKGRADIVIENRQKLRLVLELKVAEDETEAKLKLQEALDQIKSRDYGNIGITDPKDVIRYGVVLYKNDDQSKKFSVLLKRQQ